MSSGWRSRSAALGFAAAFVSALLLGPPALSTSGAASKTGGGPRVLLKGQTQWVVNSSPTASAPFVLDLATRTAPADASVSATVYDRLHTRYDFESWIRNGPRGYPLARTGPQALSGLPPDPHTAGGSDLVLNVSEGTTTTGAGSGLSVGLGCAPPTGAGTCTGVYPVEVQLLSSSGSVLDRFTTFLTYQAAKSTHPLELALVVKLAAPVSLTAHTSGPDTIAPLTPQKADALSATISALQASASVPVTVDPSPETLLALDHSGPAGRAAVDDLATLSSAGTSTEVLAAPFVPVNIGELAAAGDESEITEQLAAGSSVLRGLRIDTAGGPATWVVTGATGKDLADGVAKTGAQQVVVPGTDLSPTVTTSTLPTVAQYPGTWTSVFGLSLGKGSVHGALSDTFLTGQVAHPGDDPELTASQVLADLAMVHFERPNTTAVRGLVAVTPDVSHEDAAFYRALLAGLGHDPDVMPVNLSQYFSTVTVQGRRSLSSSGTGASLKPSLSASISSERRRLGEFDTAVDGRPRILSILDDDLLAAESADLGPRRQAAAVASFRRALSAQLALVSFGAGQGSSQTFTLTARTGIIPVTLDSRASYTVVGTLSVSGNKFIFPHAHSHPSMRLDHPTNLWRVDVKVRTSGDLPLHAVFTSPDGRLVIAQGVLTVRSTATSVVGIILSAIALIILLTWWGRTWWSSRQRRKRLAAEETP